MMLSGLIGIAIGIAVVIASVKISIYIADRTYVDWQIIAMALVGSATVAAIIIMVFFAGRCTI